MIFFLYSVLQNVLRFFLRKGAHFFPKIWQVPQRINFSHDHKVLELVKKRRDKKDCAVFFCSSAGEFEQALPLIHKHDPNLWFVHVIFFSPSGLQYAVAKNVDLSFSLMLCDSVEYWGDLFSALQPSVFFVVRHELWPGFLLMAKRWGKTYLINATSIDDASILKKWLLRQCDRVFTVKEWGDTKYDRVVERALSARLPAKTGSGKRLLVAGSVYREDIELFSQVISTCREARFIFVPHQTEFARNIRALLANHIAPDDIYVEAGNIEKLHEAVQSSARMITVTFMGFLAEIYSYGDIAYVGGGIHARVHNVLEPMAHGCAVAFGPCIETSLEAQKASTEGVAAIIENANDLKSFITIPENQLAKKRDLTKNYVQKLTGATDRIMKEIYE